jgi:hypothetical protein
MVWALNHIKKIDQDKKLRSRIIRLDPGGQLDVFFYQNNVFLMFSEFLCTSSSITLFRGVV